MIVELAASLSRRLRKARLAPRIASPGEIVAHQVWQLSHADRNEPRETGVPAGQRLGAGCDDTPLTFEPAEPGLRQ